MDGKIAIYEKSHWHLLRCGNMIGLRFVVFSLHNMDSCVSSDSRCIYKSLNQHYERIYLK